MSLIAGTEYYGRQKQRTNILSIHSAHKTPTIPSSETHMLRSLRTIAIATTFAAAAQASDAPVKVITDAAPSAELYLSLVAQAKSGQTDINYTALRYSYTKTPDYDPWSIGSRELFSEAWKAFKEDDCQTAMQKSQAALDSNFTIIAMHAVRQTCFERSGDKDKAAQEFAIGKGLNDSLLNSGDGKSADTAYIVVTVPEEGYVMSALGVQEKMQALVEKDNHSYDVLTGHDSKNDKDVGIYFQIDAVAAGEMKMFDHKNK